MLSKRIIIVNKLGLHARAAAKLVKHASRYASELYLIKDEQRVNGKSIMGVMLLAASKGVEIELITEGEDETEALADIEQLINDKFGEEE
jgi:phosphocarrier protein HPr